MDLLHIGKYGVKNAAVLLDTTSNNISNVSTTGYTRRRTNTYTSTIEWGVGDTVTSRVYNVYVQRQMYEDLGAAKYYESYLSGLNTVDDMLSDTSMSMSTSFDSLFNSMSDSVQTPSSIGAREEVIAELNIMQSRFTTLNTAMMEEVVTVNQQISDQVTSANEYLKAINKVNREIRSLAGAEGTAVSGSNNNEIYLELLDNRDLLINQLSELVDVHVVNQNDGSYCVYLSSGQLLANADSYAEFSCELNTYDPTRTDIYLSFSHYAGSTQDKTHVKMTSKNLGGSIGGLMDSTNDIRQSMRDLGQLAAAFCDAMNVQNQAGITMNGVAGGELCTVDTEVVGHGTVSGETLHASFVRTQGEKYPDCDFYVTCRQDNTVEVYLVNTDGTYASTPLQAGVDYTVSADNQSFYLEDYGLVLNFGADPTTYTGDFLVQPTMHAATSFAVKIHDAGDLAYASAVVTDSYENNFGSAVITLQGMSQTDEDSSVNTMGVYLDNDNMPQFYADAPQLIRVDTNGDYVIYKQNAGAETISNLQCSGGSHYADLEMSLTTFVKAMQIQQSGGSSTVTCNIDKNGVVFTYNGEVLETSRAAVGSNYVYTNEEYGFSFTVPQSNVTNYASATTPDTYTIDLSQALGMYTEIGRADASCKGQNVFANALTNTVPQSQFDLGIGYPGYEVNVTGSAAAGDCFVIAINVDPYADNSNGVKLAGMRNADTIRSGAGATISFSEAYADMTSVLGSKAFEANTDYEAAQSKYQQTKTVYDSVSGVQLDEEAANLVLYQQTYSACAKIIEASQTIFNALINAV